MLRLLRNRVYQKTVNYLSHAVLVQGALRGSNQTLQCLFVDNTSFTEYLLPKIYAEPPAMLKKWRIWIPGLVKILSNSSTTVDMCVAVLPVRYERKFHNLYAFKTQEYVCQVIDTSGSWEEIKKRFHHKKRQLSNNLLQNNVFTHRISKDPKEFDVFYEQMFLPHIQNRYQALSNLDRYEEMKEQFVKGFLLFVLDKDRAIAGALCIVRNDTLIFRRTGVLNGDEEYIQRGAQLALYHFNILYAHQHGLKRVDSMKSRPFLTDGVYRTKREWGATVYPDDESVNWVYYFNPRLSRKMSLYLEANPTIAWTDAGLKAVAGADSEVELSPAVKRNFVKKFYAPGLDSLALFTPNSKTPAEFRLEGDE